MTDNPNPTSAAGQGLGYSLQVTECLRQLLLAPPGAVVSLEVFEDIGVESKDGKKTAIQGKSSLTGNPVTDKSRDLWKTLANWADAVTNKRLDADVTRFRLHAFSPSSGSIAKSFEVADTIEKATAAIAEAKSTIFGVKGDAKVAATIKPYVDTFFGADSAIVARIIKNFEMTSGSGDSYSDLQAALLNKWAPENSIDQVLYNALGWVKSQLDTAVEKGLPRAIKVDDFNRGISAFIGKLRMHDLLQDFAANPDPASVAAHKLRTFVRQLEIIGLDGEQVLHAINAFLRSAHNRTQWADRGMVWPGSFDEFESSLVTFWNNTRQQQDLDHAAEPDETRGKRLLLECLKHRLRLQGKLPPDDFTPGSFHTLAEELEVGWHPAFKKRLAET